MNYAICTEYENYILGNSNSYKIVKSNMNKGDVEERTLSLLRYVFEDLLEWTPQMVRDYLTWDLLKWLKLDIAIKKIEFPSELDPQKDLFYIAHILYPKEIRYRQKDFTLQVYDKVMKGEKRKFPKGFFSMKNGQNNLKICFLYCVQQNLYDLSLKEQYLYFSDVKQANDFIKKTNLRTAYYKYYKTILELFHDSLGDAASELYYQYARFLYEISLVKGKVQHEDKN